MPSVADLVSSNPNATAQLWQLWQIPSISCMCPQACLDPTPNLWQLIRILPPSVAAFSQCKILGDGWHSWKVWNYVNCSPPFFIDKLPLEGEWSPFLTTSCSCRCEWWTKFKRFLCFKGPSLVCKYFPPWGGCLDKSMNIFKNKYRSNLLKRWHYKL